MVSQDGVQAVTRALGMDLYLSYCVGWIGVAVGQWVSSKCCNVSVPGSVRVPSGFSKVPILTTGRASRIFLKALIPCVESMFSL